ncbi:type II toxin-antitoxin system mRNA interferase toxin, RelE/StbE family [archaeon]|nr:type II toxin-antitoxin system mRNA interferase toxin, RelE/StbE family [archaeon]MBT4241935.1 type II toxin-antitoxin system mRNA interferase toxin, RelE/StbE family [archaeon]MBT4418482.1 type II toxin-antitoxin system mRNA interferase toxin, RelE/StbE family [archaeon]
MWKILSTDSFSKEFKKHKKDGEIVKALNNKIKHLKENPYFGDRLSGNLHGYFSTRLVKNFRLIYKIIKENNEVRLSAIDHRKFKYGNLRLE